MSGRGLWTAAVWSTCGTLERLIRSAAALASTVALATDAVATIVPGSGLAISNCYAVLDVDGTKALTTSRLLTCEDGDATCDLDGQCNDECLFGLDERGVHEG